MWVIGQHTWSMCIQLCIAACPFSDGCNRTLKLPIGAQWLHKNTMIIWMKSIVVPPGIRPRKMPTRRGIRTQKWSNPPLCPVGGRWGMTLIGALFSRRIFRRSTIIGDFLGIICQSLIMTCCLTQSLMFNIFLSIITVLCFIKKQFLPLKNQSKCPFLCPIKINNYSSMGVYTYYWNSPMKYTTHSPSYSNHPKMKTCNLIGTPEAIEGLHYS